MEELYVHYEDQLVGTIYRDEELVYSFTYASSWKEFPLSLAMPLKEKSFGNKTTLSFFENLLPEGQVKEDISRLQGYKEPFEFLRQYGGDCAGAISISDKRERNKRALGQESFFQLDKTKIYAAIREHRSVIEVIATETSGYLSLAGAQEKFPCVYRDGEFYLSRSGHPTTHIVKVPIFRQGVKESVYNEFFCMELARAVGFDIPKIEVIDGEEPLYVIERYDRSQDATGYVYRLHQQDFCQAQGITSAFKYENKGGPSLRDNYHLIIQNLSAKARIQGIESFLDWICFNLVIGNNDSHSKNLSLLLHKEKIVLAPIYDLLCTAIYPRLKRNFSFVIGDRDDFSRIGPNQFHHLEQQLGLKKGAFERRLRNVVGRILTAKDRLASQVGKSFPSCKIATRIAEDIIEPRVKSLKRQGLDITPQSRKTT